MVFKAAQAVSLASTDFIVTRANQAILIGAGGSLIVDMATNYPPIKSAILRVTAVDPSTGAITDVEIMKGGANYASAPIVTAVNSYGGSGANITTTLTLGVVTSVTIVSGGTDYTQTLGETQLQLSGGKGTGITLVVPAGIVPFSVSKIYKMGTTATGITLLYEAVGQGS